MRPLLKIGINSLAEGIGAVALGNGTDGASLAADRRFFATMAQAALESIPAAADADRTVADLHRVSPGRNNSISSSRAAFSIARFRSCSPAQHGACGCRACRTAFHLLGCRSDIPIGAHTMHHRSALPLREVALLVVCPPLFRLQVRLVVRREALNLFFGKADLKVI